MLTGLDTILYVHRNYVFLNTEYYPPLALNGKLDFQTSHLATTSSSGRCHGFSCQLKFNNY